VLGRVRTPLVLSDSFFFFVCLFFSGSPPFSYLCLFNPPLPEYDLFLDGFFSVSSVLLQIVVRSLLRWPPFCQYVLFFRPALAFVFSRRFPTGTRGGSAFGHLVSVFHPALLFLPVSCSEPLVLPFFIPVFGHHQTPPFFFLNGRFCFFLLTWCGDSLSSQFDGFS